MAMTSRQRPDATATDDLGRIRALVEGLPEPALIVGDGVVSIGNARARGLLGKRIEGAEVRKVFPHPAAFECLERIRPGGALNVELTGLGGSRRHWLMHVVSLGASTLLIRLADRSEARAAEQMRVDFVANASHELRTPLATLIGYTETLREHGEEIDEETRERFLAVVHDEARRMQRIVEDLISLSRIEAERFTKPTDAVALEPLIAQAIGNSRRIAEERQCELVADVATDLPDVSGDRGELLQSLDNLVTNALRYGEPGTPVGIMARADGDMVHLSITDQGEGIAPEHIARVTERFYRVDNSRSRSLGGTGLGLSIVKHIVERHRGRLTIESEVGRGTTVHVLLPIAAGRTS